ncbi:MAG: hypothetical protein F4W98_14235 [Acidimicrobiales bacterium]|nr:hypothetical protein [Acidimicrobiales bacterium]
MVHRRERWRRQVEMLSDSQRAWTVDDAITENLDLPELLRDYLSQLADAAECDAAFGVLRELTVCDPTVGSGAFLFAALDVLDPLYSEVLARAEELEARGQPVPSFLAEARTHPSSRYWLLKTICLHNLFGVDLMRDAPEIAKLRLFLKLAAQVERVEDLEPLPDLDFNIKCGNLLVGIADKRDAKERLGDGRLDLGGTLANISTVAASVAADYDRFVTQQTEAGTADAIASKARLASRFDAARADCNRLLADLRHDEGDLDDWVASHQPFHWFAEFPSVWRARGFDVIIGNPPYIKTSKVTGYRWLGYQTQNCPDLYAVCMERAATLLNDQGRFAMIVMHSLCFSRQFLSLRAALPELLELRWVSSFAKRPDLLFAGSADVRNSILIGKRQHIARRLLVTRCNRWLSVTRERLFDQLEYAVPHNSLVMATSSRQWPFSDRTVASALKTILRANQPLSESIAPHPSETSLGFKTVAQYFLSVFVEEPPTVDPISGSPAKTKSRRSVFLHFADAARRDFALIMLAGRWGYLWWLAYGDEFDFTRGTLAAFPGDIERLASRAGSVGNPAAGDMELESLLALSKTLQSEMPKHLAWQTNAGIKVGRYNMAKLRHLTDRADWLLARAWGIEDAFEAAGNLRDRMIFGNKD